MSIIHPISFRSKDLKKLQSVNDWLLHSVLIQGMLLCMGMLPYGPVVPGCVGCTC